MRWSALAALTITLSATAPAYAQETHSVAEVTIIPAGGTFFTEGTNAAAAPSFGNYTVGGSLTVKLAPWIGVEGEFASAIGVTQDLTLRGNTKSPNVLNYTGSVVLSLPTRGPVVPYAAAGLGGLTLLDKASLGIDNTETFLTGNFGGGFKWYAGRWGVRGDYRFIVVRSKDDAPAFFGQETRYGHRVYAGLILNVG
jgi:hypothetical protein